MDISVIIPCYNAQSYVAQTIGSVLEQTRPPREVIVVDDGSTDGSLAVARQFQAHCAGQVRVLSAHAGSAAQTRNLGALLATGNALMFLDADDVLAPEALAGLADALEKQPDGIALCPWHRLEQLGGRWVKRPPTCLPRKPRQDPLDAWLRGWYHPPCSVLWSRAAFERAGRWDERRSPNDDGDLVMRALAQGTALLETASGTAYYRRLPEGTVSLSGTRFTAAGIEARLRVIEKIASWLGETGRVGQYRSSLRQALWLIAVDAQPRHPDLYDRAATMARQFSPPLWARATERASRLLKQRQQWTEPESDTRSQEIRYGLGRAQQVLAMPPPGAPAGEMRLDRPAVSVIIPTYNRAHLLPRTLDSVLAQTFSDFEILVVDDGSTDDTADVVKKYHDPRIRYLPQPKNAGVSAARNRGLREARGQFIAFLDSDDSWFPRKLALQVSAMRELPAEVGLLYCGVENDDGRGNCSVVTPIHRGDVYRTLLLSNILHGTSGVIIRRGVIATAGFFDEGIPAIEDYDYWLRVARFFEFEFIAEPLIRYHDPQWMERKSLNFQENMDARAWLFRKHASEMRQAGVAHLFLLESARRHLMPPHEDWPGARRLAWQAVRQAPTSRTAWGALRRLLFRNNPWQAEPDAAPPDVRGTA